MRTDPHALERRFGAPTIVLHRADLQRVLLDALAPVRPLLGARLDRFEQEGTGVTARFEDGGEARGDLLVGADGIDSTVRRRLLADGPPRYAGYIAWRAVADFDSSGVIAGESWGAGALFGLLPLADGRLYWFGTRRAPAGEHDEGPSGASARRSSASPTGTSRSRPSSRPRPRRTSCDTTSSTARRDEAGARAA